MRFIPGMRRFISTMNAIAVTFSIDATLSPGKIGGMHAFVVYVFNQDNGDYNIEIVSLHEYARSAMATIGDGYTMIKVSMYPSMKRATTTTSITMTAIRKGNSRTRALNILTGGNNLPRRFAAAIFELLRSPPSYLISIEN